MKSYRGLKICCIITFLLILILLVAGVVIYFTLLRPKEPKILTQAITLERVDYTPPYEVNLTLLGKLLVNNPNYGSFKYENSTTFVSYRGDVVAQGLILEDTIPARGSLPVDTTILVLANSMVSNPLFLFDFVAGSFNFTTSTTLKGHAIVLQLLKIKATTYTTCDISVFFITQNAISHCSSKINF
ncbi:uncharacterized protein LOC124909735 [Impatiens glandulifera]|uniref:uncharacterized protein LOC124909735 n=1 Tax=Impatiens glandulifera TaxID=253017 RepID=UPI001FB0FB9B|nr:uncharacterized protein LOC124909735 [Impatiens glandulifera]